MVLNGCCSERKGEASFCFWFLCNLIQVNYMPKSQYLGSEIMCLPVSVIIHDECDTCTYLYLPIFVSARSHGLRGVFALTRFGAPFSFEVDKEVEEDEEAMDGSNWWRTAPTSIWRMAICACPTCK
jgi:hypothetical protein